LTSPRVPLYLQILVGLTLGVATGAWLGKDASVLGEIGRLVIQLVKLFAGPLLLFAILDAFLKTEIAARAAGLALVRLVTPTTPPDRAEEIARRSTGFLYCVSVAGVTGTRTELPPGLVERVRWLRGRTDVPVLVGFGIATPEQARAVAAVADGVIVGSAVVRLLAEAEAEAPEPRVRRLESYLKDLAAAVGGRGGAGPA
jgi:tryptophan synthase alpha chain